MLRLIRHIPQETSGNAVSDICDQSIWILKFHIEHIFYIWVWPCDHCASESLWIEVDMVGGKQKHACLKVSSINADQQWGGRWWESLTWELNDRWWAEGANLELATRFLPSYSSSVLLSDRRAHRNRSSLFISDAVTAVTTTGTRTRFIKGQGHTTPSSAQPWTANFGSQLCDISEAASKHWLFL